MVLRKDYDFIILFYVYFYMYLRPISILYFVYNLDDNNNNNYIKVERLGVEPVTSFS